VCSPRHSELCLQPLCQCRVTDRVEGCGEIEAYKQYYDFLAVSRNVDAVKDIEQRRLSRMSLPVGRLPLAEVLGVCEVGTQTCQHNSLEHLGRLSIKAKAYNTCIAPQVAYRNSRGAGHDTERAGVEPINCRLSLRPQADL